MYIFMIYTQAFNMKASYHVYRQCILLSLMPYAVKGF